NVIFELGVSFGQLGRDRTFILAPGDLFSDLRRPSDLFGVNPILYDAANDPRDAMKNAANEVLEVIEKLGPRPRSSGDGALGRGDTSSLHLVADGALHVFESRHTYADQLRGLVEDNQRIPAKLQFAQPD